MLRSDIKESNVQKTFSTAAQTPEKMPSQYELPAHLREFATVKKPSRKAGLLSDRDRTDEGPKTQAFLPLPQIKLPSRFLQKQSKESKAFFSEQRLAIYENEDFSSRLNKAM